MVASTLTANRSNTAGTSTATTGGVEAASASTLIIPSQCVFAGRRTKRRDQKTIVVSKHNTNDDHRRREGSSTSSSSLLLFSASKSFNCYKDALFLTPSQCIRSQKQHLKNHRNHKTKLNASSKEEEEKSSLPSSLSDERQSTAKYKSKNKHNKTKKNNHDKRISSSSNKKSNRRISKAAATTTGDLPNISWRAIPMHHLRQHPSFDELPHPREIKEIRNWDDVSRFRQDSIQWDLLHAGRCTTSRAACALGILEPKAAAELGIPVSLRKRGHSAYEHLKGRAITGLEEMNYVLCGHDHDDDEYLDCSVQYDDENHDDSSTIIWGESPPQQRQHVAQYLYKPSISSIASNASFSARRHASTVVQARMQWGSAQESTSVLTAINYFCTQLDPNIRIREVGMCVGETSGYAHRLADGLFIGASPDAVIAYPDGTLEALEVKNHCPFIKAWWHRNIDPEKRKKFAISCQVPNGEIPATYIPQLMMEMLCLGPACKSAIMVRQTATKGAVVVRLKRDDAWIDDMLHFLSRFQTEYVNAPGDNPPPSNFFWDDVDAERRTHYRNFVKRTREIGKECCEIVSYIEHRDIQRACHFHDEFGSDVGIASKENKSARTVVTPLFLDSLV
eukprot:CAMPEP_0196808310 /NCGR_PEP_ID=MMETSP1362-20130617/8302_1 /TAXON_ID=163516 /ORGANISM="Leptocylindrus danicus, Strain CCMP1856" /LENGTH=619 /DNA_ID=CAMNT_0042182603 /DNA_START=57 /DNA_END=1916 /DNA_ORIENTATION=+